MSAPYTPMSGTGFEPKPSLARRVDQSGWLLLAARLVLGVTFIWMGVQKISEPPATFLKLIRMFEMVPESPAIYLNSMAIVLPWLEVVCGLVLLLGIFVRGAGLLMVLLLVVFSTAIFLRAWSMRATEQISFFQVAFDCGCGSGEVIIWKKLLSNAGLLALAFIPLLSRSRRFCLAKT